MSRLLYLIMFYVIAKGILHSVSPLYDRTQEILEQLTLTELLTRLLQVGSSPLFDISVDEDEQNFVFQILPGKINSYFNEESTMRNKEKQCLRTLNKNFNSKLIEMNIIYKKYVQCLSNYSDYLNTAQKALNTFGEFSYLHEYNATWHISEILTTIELDILKTLDETLSAFLLRHDFISRNFREIKLSELQSRYSLIDWKTLFSNLVGKSMSENLKVHLYFESFFDNLFHVYSQLGKRQQYNALLGMFAHDLYTTLVLPVQADDYEKFCMRQTSRLLPEISSVMYLHSWGKSEISSAQTDLENTFANVKAHMAIKLKNTEWLDEISESSILNKLDNIHLYYGRTELMKNESYFNNKYKDTFDGYNDTYPECIIALTKQNMKFKYELVHIKNENIIEDNVWWYYLTSYANNPISIYSTNSLVVPLGMVLNVPRKVPVYIHLAQVEYPIARAIGYQFDPIGINYGLEMSETALKTYNTLKTYATDKAAFTTSHTFNDKEITFTLIGNLTLSERITEDMALEVVLDMSKNIINNSLLPWLSETFSWEKILFLNIAQRHCKNLNIQDYMINLFESDHMPPSLLVKNLFASNKNFEEIFSCPSGSKMNHQQKCKTIFNLIQEDDYNYK